MDKNQKFIKIKLRAVAVNVAEKLTARNIKSLAVIYNVKTSLEGTNHSGADLMEHLLQQELVANSRRSLDMFKECLEKIERKDLTHLVDEYLEKYYLPLESSDLAQGLFYTSTTQGIKEDQPDLSKSTAVPGQG